MNNDSNPSEIAGGAVLGVILGLTPFFALHNLLVIFLLFILKVNGAAAVVTTAIFGLIGYLIDPLSHMIGESILTAGFLEKFWTYLYNIPLIPFARLNNTVILGSLLISIILAPFLFILTRKFVVYYRASLREKVDKLRIMKILKASKIFKLYMRLSR